MNATAEQGDTSTDTVEGRTGVTGLTGVAPEPAELGVCTSVDPSLQVSVPINTFLGDCDPLVSPMEMEQWKNYTTSHNTIASAAGTAGSVSNHSDACQNPNPVVVFPSAGHFYFSDRENQSILVGHVLRICSLYIGTGAGINSGINSGNDPVSAAVEATANLILTA